MKKVAKTLLITLIALIVLIPICTVLAWLVYHSVSWFILKFGMLAFKVLVPTLCLIFFAYNLVRIMLEDKHDGWWN